MTRNVRLAGALLCPLALALAGTISPPPAPCPASSTPLSAYVALGSTGCTMGGFSVSDFQFAVQPGGTGSPIDASAVAVQWSASPAGVGLRFSSNGFQVGAAESLGYWLTYNIGPAPAPLGGFGDTLWMAPYVGTPPVIIRGGDGEDDGGTEVLAVPLAVGSVIVDTQLCVGGLFTGPGNARTCSLGSTAGLSVYFYNPGGSQESGWLTFGSPAGAVGVLNFIRLDGGGAEGGARFWALDNQAYLVPEPACWLAVGGGLALLAFWRRRRAP